ncbi:glycosyltransferase family 4 protein [Butyrivibrio sp. INlla14]|uniref:glycosyltransferase family 4 protein n=1 Tax=Butyrivibrio sp. INlla14 TaxID=1520808 RepID=UPI000876CEEB|nr:glycosyltransferase family 4 protein [Butyrivibrio sp. INlla14]SCY72576.1 hypothetical protein SAMN02910371_03593 [Butyrivibrio sp. INlla14]
MRSKDIKGYIEKVVDELKKRISICICKEKYNDALSLISICSFFLYSTNIYYTDEELEKDVEIIANFISNTQFASANRYSSNDCTVFYDGFGLNNRGLVQIYLQALCKIRRVVYVTYLDRKECIPDVLKILEEYESKTAFICREKRTKIEQIMQLSDIVQEYKPENFFFYAPPDDVIATSVMHMYKESMKRYQINLTDHAFWIGTRCIDKCIEFRRYGARISSEYRGIESKKITIIPFYPIIDKSRQFQGYPFEREPGQKVIFSGGALYKTIDEKGIYYTMLDSILSHHENVIFWYAGSGDDSKLLNLREKYPKRVFHTDERSDLFQIMENIDVYFSTYPMCGGLMFQYAALAGVVPVTLKHGDISDDFLIDQDNIKVEFADQESLYAEIDRLLSDETYVEQRKYQMKRSVISQDSFEKQVIKLLNNEDNDDAIAEYQNIDTEEFRKWYLEKLTKADVDSLLVNHDSLKIGIKYYPFVTIRGGVNILKRKVVQK